ncbi:MAG: SRPBCC family protein [Candidatus Krumholzibacteria bacterium]|nr:SRPBCC family protein [Candidatus Krumholzibacteria bacterium]
MRLHVLERTQAIASSREEVFGFFARPENLAAITPPRLDFRILTPSPVPMRNGALIDYVIKLGPLPLHWRTLITCYEPPFRFIDEQLQGPYAFWHHTHQFDELPDGGTRLGDIVRYLLPLGPFGEIAHILAVRRQLAQIFDHRRRVIAARFGERPDPGKEQP